MANTNKLGLAKLPFNKGGLTNFVKEDKSLMVILSLYNV